jgi:hypothetical protein
MSSIYSAIKAGEYFSYLKRRQAERQAINESRRLSRLAANLEASSLHDAMLAEIARRIYARYHPFSYGVEFGDGEVDNGQAR